MVKVKLLVVSLLGVVMLLTGCGEVPRGKVTYWYPSTAAVVTLQVMNTTPTPQAVRVLENISSTILFPGMLTPIYPTP